MLFYIESIQIDGSPIIWSMEEGDSTAFCTFCVLDKTKNPNKDRFMAATKEVSTCTQRNDTISITINADTPCIEVKDHATIKPVHLQKSGDDLATWRQKALSRPSLFSLASTSVVDEVNEVRPQSAPELVFCPQPTLFDRLTENNKGQTTCYEGDLFDNNQQAIVAYSHRVLILEADLLPFAMALRHSDSFSLRRSQVRLMRQIVDSLIQPAAESMSGTHPIRGNIKHYLINAILNALSVDPIHTQPSTLESPEIQLDIHAKAAPRPSTYPNRRVLSERVKRAQDACLDFYVLTDTDILPEELTTDSETIAWLTAMRQALAPHRANLQLLLNRLAHLTACLGIMEANYRQLTITKPLIDYRNFLTRITTAKWEEQLLGFALAKLDPLDRLQPPTLPELSQYCSITNHLTSLFRQTRMTFSIETIMDTLRSILIRETKGQTEADNPFAPLLPKVKATNKDTDFYLRLDWQIELDARLVNQLAERKQAKRLTCDDLANAIWQFIQEKSLAILDANNQSTQVATYAPSRV